ncbi:MAG: hypothetical protein Q8S32_06450 [Burkholderiaceae bacterium]|nr:hypothetical protein [Burkholderiaceae bacterium]
MIIAIEGIVERYGPSLVGHGDHGFSVLLVGSKTIYYFSGVRSAYSPLIGRPSASSSILVELMALGDHISFEVEGVPEKLGFVENVINQTLRNWTLENRLMGVEVDVTPKQNCLDQVTKKLPLSNCQKV